MNADKAKPGTEVRKILEQIFYHCKQ